MKRKLLALTLALSMCGVPVYADDAVTAESVLQGMQEYSANAASEAMTMTLNLDAALKMVSEDAMETSIPVSMTGSFDIQEILDPIQMSLNGNFKVSILGQSNEIAMEMYMVMEDEQADTYVNETTDGVESGWQHTSVDMDELLDTLGISSLEELSSASVEDLLGADLDWTLTEENDSYKLEGQLAFSDILPLIEASMGADGEVISDEELDQVKSILSAFKMNMSYVVEKETFATRSCHIDFNDSDITAVNDIISDVMADALGSDDSTSISLEVNDFSMDMEISQDTVTSIEIPQEALDADTVDVNALVEEATELAE